MFNKKYIPPLDPFTDTPIAMAIIITIMQQTAMIIAVFHLLILVLSHNRLKILENVRYIQKNCMSLKVQCSH